MLRVCAFVSCLVDLSIPVRGTEWHGGSRFSRRVCAGGTERLDSKIRIIL